MKITEELIERVHKKANKKLHEGYPMLDMADLSKHPEGHIKEWEVKYILEAYNERD